MKTLILLAVATASLTSCSSVLSRSGFASPPAAGSSERLIQRTGSMTMKSRSLKVSSEKSVALAHQHQALVMSSSLTEDRYDATLRVPAGSLASLMDSLSSVGRVTQRQVEMTDVTEATLDLQAALRNKRALRDRLRSLLERATKVEDILKIEKELSRVQTELDQMEARMKSMTSQVSHSTLNLSIKRDRIPGPLGAVTKGTSWLFGKLNHLN